MIPLAKITHCRWCSTSELRGDPLSSHLLVFCNRTRDKLEILCWLNNGFWLWYRRWERALLVAVGAPPRLGPAAASGIERVAGETRSESHKKPLPSAIRSIVIMRYESTGGIIIDMLQHSESLPEDPIESRRIIAQLDGQVAELERERTQQDAWIAQLLEAFELLRRKRLGRVRIA